MGKMGKKGGNKRGERERAKVAIEWVGKGKNWEMIKKKSTEK